MADGQRLKLLPAASSGDVCGGLACFACFLSEVTTYDSSFSYRQDQVARLGESAKRETTEEDRSRLVILIRGATRTEDVFSKVPLCSA